MGCLKLTYHQTPVLKIISTKKELTYNKSKNNGYSNYLYGFNGQEGDDEINGEGNSYDFGARIYNSRLGRWMSMDPFNKLYPSYCPYSFAVNSPLMFIDADGNLVRDASGKIVYQTSGTLVTARHPGGDVIMEVGYVTADNGTKIKVYRNTDATKPGFNTNCHGTTFLDGEYWLNSPEVEGLLANDGYKEVDKKNINVGDAVVLDDASQKSTHSVTITKTGSTEDDIEVEGLGGTQETTKKTSLEDAWINETKTSYYRKEAPKPAVTPASTTTPEVDMFETKTYPPLDYQPPRNYIPNGTE